MNSSALVLAVEGFAATKFSKQVQRKAKMRIAHCAMAQRSKSLPFRIHKLIADSVPKYVVESDDPNRT